jgi:predicted RNA-binding protein
MKTAFLVLSLGIFLLCPPIGTLSLEALGFKENDGFPVKTNVQYVQAQYTKENDDSIKFEELPKYVVDYLIFRQEYRELPMISNYDIMKALIDILGENNITIKIYNGDVTLYNPEDTVEYIALVSDGNRQGFEVVNVGNQEMRKDSKIIFSFTCEFQVDSLTGAICSEDKVNLTVNGEKLAYRDAMTKSNIFLRALKDTTRSTADDAG